MAEDGARSINPFAFTTGGSGDFRPQVINVKNDPENKPDRDDTGTPVETPKTDPVPTSITDTQGAQAPDVPKDSSAQEPASSPQVVPTVDEFDKQLAQSQSVPVGTDSQNDLEDTSAPQKPSAPPTLAERANASKTASNASENS